MRSLPVSADYDIAVIGSGFAGSLFAMIARRLGKSVILLERGRHPRFAIGESTTPLSNLLLEELATRYQLPDLLPLCKWGTWQASHSELACGLKRGFTFYHHRPGLEPRREDQLLVAASPRDAIADTHWYRADVDAFFVRAAQEAGVEYCDEVRLESARELDDGIALAGEGVDIKAKFVIDASGPRGFLHRAFGLPEMPLPGMPATEALYTHFAGVRRVEETDETPPYPVDDAAVHDIFDGGWIWVLRFANGITSAGVAARFPLGDGAAAWQRLIDRYPAIRAQFASAVATRPFVHTPRPSFRSGAIAGRRWALLPSTAGFVDPLLSTGFPLTLQGVARLARFFEGDGDLLTYARQTDDELLATARLIGGLFASMANFPVFVSLTLLYFAAASFSETARRLGKPELAPSFLLCDNPRFDMRPLLDRARDIRTEEESRAFANDVRRFIEPFNVAGLGDSARGNWYPADAEDMLRAAGKLGASRTEVAEVLRRCGFNK